MYGSVHSLSQELKDFAIERGPNSKMPTVSELCRLFGTSTATLNTALKDLEEKNVISRRQGSGIFVSHKLHKKMILVLLESSFFFQQSTSPFWGVLWGHMAQIAQERVGVLNEAHQFHLVTTHSTESHGLPENTLQMIERGMVDSVIDIGLHDDARLQIEKHGVPCVTYAAFGLPQVMSDQVEAMRLSVESLAKQGCRRIGFWVAADAHRFPLPISGTNGLSEFHAEIERQGLTHHSELIHYFGSRLRADEICYESVPQQGRIVAREVLSGPRAAWPDGVVIATDIMSLGALWQMQSMGLQIGADIKVATQGNAGSTVLFGYDEKITVVEYDTGELAQRLFAIAGMLIAGQPVDESMRVVKPRLRINREVADVSHQLSDG
jgi:DNA-binding LacI/PurR family transcriptional regulator